MANKLEFSFVQDVIDEMKLEKKLEEFANANCTCYNCSIAEMEAVKLTGDEIPFDQKDQITILHDLIYRCANKTETVKPRMNCRQGDKALVDHRCANCAFAGQHLEGTYKKGSASNRMLVKQELIHCKNRKKHMRKTEYAYPYYRCEHFKRKEG